MTGQENYRNIRKRRVGVLTVAAVLLFTLLAPPLAVAVLPDEVLADPALELRARELSKRLRCLVCQNQSIDDSEADLARDLRILVRERLKAGDSDQQVLAFLVARYGDFVLLKPPVKPETWLLWFGPFAVLGISALAVLIAAMRRKGTSIAPPAPLDESERAEVARLLRDAHSGNQESDGDGTEGEGSGGGRAGGGPP